jgi:regulator of cell morphogenesis and NO signaling
MNAIETKTVRELAIELPHATRVFEKFGIDYCCGGKKPLDEACEAAGSSLGEVLKALDAAAQEPPAADQKELLSGSLAELIDHIVKTHHKFTREELARLQALTAKVNSVHGKNHPELQQIQDTFAGLMQELLIHLMKEEQILFPYIIRVEEASAQQDPLPPAPFGSVENPIRMMSEEHDSAGDALRAIRSCSNNFRVPDDACISYRTLYAALEGFEADLHQHIHKENNSLFPRAVAMERNLGRKSA